jgi:hypothetical protein
MKIRLNLATTPLESTRRFAVVSSAIAFAGLLGLFLLSGQVYRVWTSDRDMRAKQSALQDQVASLQRQRQLLTAYFQQPETVKRRERAAYLNALIEQRAFPWIKIFMDLEQILPEGVRVVRIEPKLDGDTVQLKLLVGASTDEGKLKFLKALETSHEFSSIQLLNETRPVKADQADRVVIELQALYSVT